MEKQVVLSSVITANFGQQVTFLQRLVQARSANPYTPETSAADIPVEKEVATVTYQELQRLGFTAELRGVTQERPNVVSTFPGSGSVGKTLILSTHMDTVEPSGYTRDPWGAQIEGGLLYGVGAADAKAQIAAFIYAAQALREAGIALAGKVTLAFVVDEEPGACSRYGTQYLFEQGLVQGDAAIIGEPGNSQVSIGHRGLYRFRLQIQGEATHTGRKAWENQSEGRNAILDMARIALALSTYPLPETASEAYPDRKSVLTFPTLIRGGSGINVVPGLCEAYGDVRLLPGLSAASVKDLIKEQLRALSIEAYQLDDLLVVPAAETNPHTKIVQALAAAIETMTGMPPRLAGSGPACDGWMFTTRGIPTVCGYGVSCGGVHGADEWADLESLRTITEIYALTILAYLGA
jgi:succinyl-diaminopimelate desuccinylase